MGSDNDPADDGQNGVSYSRRRIMGGIGVTLGAVLAGCSGGGDGSDGSSGRKTTKFVGGGTNVGPGATQDDPQPGGGGLGTMGPVQCPSPSFEYQEVTVSSFSGDLATTEAPKFAQVMGGGGVSITLKYERRTDSISIQGPQEMPEDAAERSMEDLESGGEEEMTSRFDFRTAGSRAWATTERRTESGLPEMLVVYVPSSEGYVTFNVLGTREPRCPEVYTRAYEHFVESVEPI